ncbi:hypothetical protein ID866_2994 [Astraeus odoratus]|nr:hypothetical protein ID866_2994 [Astraeus odoratus]
MLLSSNLKRVSRRHGVCSYPRRLLSSGIRGLRETGAPVDIHPEIEDALANCKPVVALESTIITHGMPYPTSIDMAWSVESIVRSTGSIPATIGIIDGRVKVGLQSHELERLARRTADPVKISRRDISAAIVSKKDGGTTCSSTLIFAALAGIKVFATGGLGGVHRGGENTMDVSADLHELTRCPVGLVSAGVKSILDIGRTLEYLETLGVPVLTYASTTDFPAFYTRRSGHQAPWNVNDATDAAGILWMGNGALFAVPIPEEYEAAGAAVQKAVEVAVRESEELGISKLGKEVTPWLLKRVGELTEGRSLENNIALIQNTAHSGGQIAHEYAKLVRSKNETQKHFGPGLCQTHTHLSDRSHAKQVKCGVHDAPSVEHKKASMVVVGCAAVDITSKIQETSDISEKTTYPGMLSLTLGGVGRNIAEAAHRVLARPEKGNAATLLVAPIGEDAFGKFIVDSTQSIGMRTDGLLSIAGQRSAVCNLLLDAKGGLQGGVADMELPQLWKGTEAVRVLQDHQPQFLVLDGNLSTEAITSLVTEAIDLDIRIFFEPTSVVKSSRILPAVAVNMDRTAQSVISYASPNLLELRHMYDEARITFDLMSHDYWWKVVDDFALDSNFRMELDKLAKKAISEESPSLGDLSFLVDQGVIQMAIHLLPFFHHLVIKCGELGVVTVMRLMHADVGAWLQERRCVTALSRNSTEIVIVQHHPPVKVSPSELVNTTGAGDSLVGALLAMLIQHPATFLNPGTLNSAMDIAQQAAIMSLRSSEAVSPLLSTLPHAYAQSDHWIQNDHV